MIQRSKTQTCSYWEGRATLKLCSSFTSMCFTWLCLFILHIYLNCLLCSSTDWQSLQRDETLSNSLTRFTGSHQPQIHCSYKGDGFVFVSFFLSRVSSECCGHKQISENGKGHEDVACCQHLSSIMIYNTVSPHRSVARHLCSLSLGSGWA